MFCADAAANDDEIGRKQKLDVLEINIQAVAPFFPGQITFLAHAVGGKILCVFLLIPQIKMA